MNASVVSFSASDAAKQLGVSIKALRLYEQRGLLSPLRSESGYRLYGPSEMARAARIVSLRALGLRVAEVARVLDGDSRSLDAALAAHQTVLGREMHQLSGKIDRVGRLRADLAESQQPRGDDWACLHKRVPTLTAAFALPWPWGGEWFELNEIRPLNYIIGPLGSGKTRLAQRLAQALPKAAFLGLDRLDEATTRRDEDPLLAARVARTLAWLIAEGAVESHALNTLITGLETEGPDVLVVDMVEQGLGPVSQEALMRYLRARAQVGARSLFLMTRSSAICDLAAVGPDEAIILCPANHSPPRRVLPFHGAAGYEALAQCLATPEVRARVAVRPAVTAIER